QRRRRGRGPCRQADRPQRRSGHFRGQAGAVTRKKVAILISGRGSNMAALIEASRAPDYPAQIVGVLSNRAAAPGLEIAARHGIATASLAQSRFPSRDLFEDTMTQVLESWESDFVCLAGFMRILGADFVNHWLGRMINIH